MTDLRKCIICKAVVPDLVAVTVLGPFAREGRTSYYCEACWQELMDYGFKMCVSYRRGYEDAKREHERLS